jgi:outer membrane protein insertion porin family
MSARAVATALLLWGAAASAQTSWPQKIRDIRVFDNTKTATGTVIDLAGVQVGEDFTPDELQKIKQNLINAGLFSDVNVYYEPFLDGIRMNIVAKDKFAWFAAPTFSASTGNVGGGIAFGHTNLFGLNKKLLLYGALFNSDSRLLAVYQDPALFGSVFFWRIDGGISRSKIDEDNLSMQNDPNLENPQLFRRTPIWSPGGGLQLGVNLPAHLHGSLYYRIQDVIYEPACITDACATMGSFPYSPLVQAPGESIADFAPGSDGSESYVHADFGFDSTVNTWGIRTGMALGAWYEYGDKALGTKFSYMKYGGSGRIGIRFFEEHNLILRGGYASGFALPFTEELEGGGSGLRGFNYREFRGDTSFDGHIEYYIPIVWAWSMAVRGLVFWDSQAMWWNNLKDSDFVAQPNGTYRVTHPDGTFRDFLPEIDGAGVAHPPRTGLDFDHWHNGVGGGMRLYLKSINIPLLGFDFGYGVQSHETRFYIALGLSD